MAAPVHKHGFGVVLIMCSLVGGCSLEQPRSALNHVKQTWQAQRPRLALSQLKPSWFGKHKSARQTTVRPSVTASDKVVVAKSCYPVRAEDTLYGIAHRHGLDQQQLAKENELSPPYNLTIGSTLCHSATTAIAEQSKPSLPKQRMVSSEIKSHATPSKNDNNHWVWPVQGRVIHSFLLGSKQHQGIEIESVGPRKVVAAQSGKVIYAGTGLKDYGNLLIIKHSDSLLTAYANNDRLYVHEGDYIEKGETIARLQASGEHHYILHFEVRRDGLPINPTQYLPS